jgi:hypothetical protein
MNIPNLMPYQMNSFNGDGFIEDSFKQFQKEFNLKAAIETGTCLGSTTLFLSTVFEKVLTIENNKGYALIAINRAKALDLKNIDFIHGDSGEILSSVIYANKIGDDTMFFLDAHWSDNCPLIKELEAIAENKIRPVIAVHDFKVPNNPTLGFDSYNGQDFTLDWIKPHVDLIYGGAWDYHYNTDEESEGAKRGIIYIYPTI